VIMATRRRRTRGSTIPKGKGKKMGGPEEVVVLWGWNVMLLRGLVHEARSKGRGKKTTCLRREAPGARRVEKRRNKLNALRIKSGNSCKGGSGPKKSKQ